MEFSKDRHSKDGLCFNCKTCQNLNYLPNKEKIAVRQAIYRSEHKEEKAAYQAAYDAAHKKERAVHYIEHKKEINAKSAAYYIAHKKDIAIYNKNVRKYNPGKINARNRKRKLSKLQATPKWLTKSQLLQIEAIYIEAARLTKETGIPNHVDHIIPLHHSDICGLHVPCNLQILTATENLKKSNKLFI